MLHSPVQAIGAAGGSGAEYQTVQAAIDAEQDAVIAGLVPQAGTGAGVFVGAAGVGLSVVDDFYVGYYLVNSDLTPSNGLVARASRVTAYVAATRTFTLSDPWDFSAESTCDLILPAKVTVFKDATEDLVVTKNLELNGAGHNLEGRIDQTGGTLLAVRALGVRAGVQKTNYGRLELENCEVWRRGATLYTVLLTSGSNLGRMVAKNCTFHGRVAGRRGFIGWEISGCQNRGLNDGVQGVPYALVESVAGAAIVVSAVDVELSGAFSGAVLYSENSITGAGAFISVQGAIEASEDFYGINMQNRRFALGRAVGAAILTPAFTSGSINLRAGILQSQPFTLAAETLATAGFPFTLSILAVQDFTGTANLDLNMTNGQCLLESDSACFVSLVTTEGTVACSGAVTLRSSGSNVFPNVRSARGNVAMVCLAVDTGAAGVVTNSMIVGIYGALAARGFHVAASQTGGGAATISGGWVAEFCPNARPFALDSGLVAVSAGTFTHSGSCTGTGVGNCIISASLTGSTITLSGNVQMFFSAVGGTVQYRMSGAGGTLNITSSLQDYVGGRRTTFELAGSTGAGATVANTGAAITIDGAISTATAAWVNATTATSTARVTGTVTFRNCSFAGAHIALNATAVGGVAAGPSSLVYENCVFESSFTDQTGAGTLTWAAAALIVRNCSFVGTFTYNGTSFATVQGFDTIFSGPLVGGGARPATLQFFHCTFLSSYLSLLPDIVETYFELPSAAALVRGQLVEIRATQIAGDQTAIGMLAGVNLNALGGAGGATIVVTKGRVFVNCAAGVADGAFLVVDAAGTPTQAVTAANLAALVLGQTVGQALEAVGATVANQAYSEVNVR